MTNFWALHEDEIVRSRLGQLLPDRNKMFIEVEDLSIGGRKVEDYPESIRGSERLCAYAKQISTILHKQRTHTYNFNMNLSYTRCTGTGLSFPLTWRLIDSCKIPLKMNIIQSGIYNPRISKTQCTYWSELILSTSQRLYNMNNIIEHFVFVIPPVKTVLPYQASVFTHCNILSERDIEHTIDTLLYTPPSPYTDVLVRDSVVADLTSTYRHYYGTYYPTYIRQTISFPDRKLGTCIYKCVIQYMCMLQYV